MGDQTSVAYFTLYLMTGILYDFHVIVLTIVVTIKTLYGRNRENERNLILENIQGVLLKNT